MANEIQFQTSPIFSGTAYVLIRDVTAQVWNGSAFTAWSNASLASYAIAATEQGTGTGFYVATFPTAIGSGNYSIVGYKQSGGSPAVSDTPVSEGMVYWSGSTLSAAPPGSTIPNTITAYTYTRDAAGAAAGSKTVRYRLLSPPAAGDGTWDTSLQTVTSDSNGLAQMTMAVGAIYQWQSGNGLWNTVSITNSTTNPYELPEAKTI